MSLKMLEVCKLSNVSISAVLGILNSPIRSILGKQSGYLPPESMSMTADFLEKFPSMARMANRLDSSSFLDSRSSSPEDSETSGFSSGSDHLCDMLVRPDGAYSITVLFVGLLGLETVYTCLATHCIYLYLSIQVGQLSWVSWSNCHVDGKSGFHNWGRGLEKSDISM